jgi:two-component system sensor histidine kinase KdpD
LALIKAASSSLLSTQLQVGPEETPILLHPIDDETDRRNALVEDLLDMSRLETGPWRSCPAPPKSENSSMPPWPASIQKPKGVTVLIDLRVPALDADPMLIERVVANLVDNAFRHGAGMPVGVEAGALAGRVDIRVIDDCTGIGPADRDFVFRPFQRLVDSVKRTGLRLAVSRGFAKAVG